MRDLRYITSKFFGFSISIVILILACSLSACSISKMSSKAPQKLLISVDSSDEITIIRHETLNGMHERDIQYRYLDNVNITVDNKQLPFDEAIRNGSVSTGEIFALARIDAQNGFCTEKFESSHGVSHFTYTYPDFNLRIIYDIYETPDGKQTLINDIMLYSSKRNIGPYVDFYSEETGERLDREDWGITLEAVEVTPTGITVKCTQSGGQQIGQLYTSWYTLQDKNGFVSNLANSGEAPSLELPVKKNDSTVIHIDWTTIYGKLPSGDYQLVLYIEDQFDPSDVHPLMDNFHDMQGYSIPFSIP